MSQEKEYTGGSVSYYAVDVNAPINEESDPYTAECQDIIEALKLDFQEGNVLKAIWRRAAARLGRSKKGYDDGLYDAEKIVFYGQRLVAIEQSAKAYKGPFATCLEGETSNIELDVKMPSGSWYVGPGPKDATHRWSICGQFAKRAGGENWALWQNEEWLFIGAELKGEMIPLEKPEQDPYGPRDAEGWYAWKGDETMRPAGRVEIVLRDGMPGSCSAESLSWGHGLGGADIVKWRPAQ